MSDLIQASYDLVSYLLIPIAFAMCLLYFFWGIVKYMKNSAGSEQAAEEAKKTMLWGVVALFVASSVWGIISFIRSELSIAPLTEINIGN